MKLSPEAYEVIIKCLEHSKELAEKEKYPVAVKNIEEAIQEVETIGTN